MPAVRTTRSTSQDMGGTDTGNRGTVETSSSAVQALKEVDSRSISALGRGRDENFTLGYSSKRPARLKCGIQQTTDRLKTTVTTVGEFCRGVLSTSRKILWNISIVDSQCRRRLRILDAGEEEAVPEDAAVMGGQTGG